MSGGNITPIRGRAGAAPKKESVSFPVIAGATLLAAGAVYAVSAYDRKAGMYFAFILLGGIAVYRNAPDRLTSLVTAVTGR